MWTFDRYQRWMEQKTDWVRPASPRSPAVEETVRVVNVPKTAPNHPPAHAPASGATPGAPEQQPDITIDEEMDLNEIAELARKIEQRTR